MKRKTIKRPSDIGELINELEKRIGDFTDRFCIIEGIRPGYMTEVYSNLIYTVGSINEEQQEKLQRELNEFLYLVMDKIDTGYINEKLVEKKSSLREDYQRRLPYIPTLDELREHWNEYEKIIKEHQEENFPDLETEITFELWSDNCINSLKQNHREVRNEYKNALKDLREEILNRRSSIRVGKEKIVLNFYFKGPLLDTVYEDFAKFLEDSNIKGEGFLPGGVLDSHRPLNVGNSYTPSERSEDMYQQFFLKQARTREQYFWKRK